MTDPSSPLAHNSTPTQSGSRPSTADERLRELNRALKERHNPDHRLHFFGRPGSGGSFHAPRAAAAVTREGPPATQQGAEDERTWSNSANIGTQSLVGRIQQMNDGVDLPTNRHMSRRVRVAADREAKAAEAANARELQHVCEKLPWWRRIVVDEGFRRRVATLAARAIRAQEGFHRPDGDAQCIALPPMYRWEAMSAENRVVQPTPGASCGPLDGVTHRWKGPFPPNGYVQLTPNVLNLRPNAEKKGPLHINVYVPMRPPQKRGGAAGQDAPDAMADGAGDRVGAEDDGSEHRTIGRMILDYEDAQRRKWELEVEAKRQQREAMSGVGGGSGITSKGKLVMDSEGFLTVDGVRLEQRYLGTLRPSFLLLRWRIMCNAIHEYAESSSGIHVGREVVGGTAVSGAASTPAPSVVGSNPATPRRRQPGDAMEAPGSLPSVVTGVAQPGVPPWLDGLPRFSIPVYAVESKPANLIYDERNDTHRVEAHPAARGNAFSSIRREDIPESRRLFLFQAPACRKAVHRVYQELPQDATGRIHQAGYVEFMLDLLDVFFPTFHAQSNIEVAEDEWLCRGVPEFPDFAIFYRNMFDVPLILCRERNTMTEEQYISVWDLLYEALHGREKLLALYEVDIQRTQNFLGTNVEEGKKSGQGGETPVLQNGWMDQLPPYLCPSSPESSLRVPRRKNADNYALYRVSTHIESTNHQVLQSDPSRRTFLIHRLASTRLAQRSTQASPGSGLSPAASFRQARRRLPHGQSPPTSPTGGGCGGSDDDTLASPLLDEMNSDLVFPSLALQVKQLTEREKAASSTQHRSKRPAALNEKQREEARRINEMLAIENKASSLILYQEVYEAPELPRDDIDDILDYCSELSDSQMGSDGGDVAGEAADGAADDVVEMDRPSDDAEAAAAAAAALQAQRKRSIRALYAEAKHQRELREERDMLEAQEVRLQQQRRAAAQLKMQQDSQLLPTSGQPATRRRNSSFSATGGSGGGAFRRTSLLVTSAIKLGSPSIIGTGIQPEEVPEATKNGGATMSSSIPIGQQRDADPQPRMVLSPEHAQRVRRAERERVRALAIGGGGIMVVGTTDGGGSVTSAAAPVAPAQQRQYRTFLSTHLTQGAQGVLDPAPATNSPARPTSRGGGMNSMRTTRGGRRPETATSAHASLSVNPFMRLSSNSRKLLVHSSCSSTRPPGNLHVGSAAESKDGQTCVAEDPRLVTEDPNGLHRAAPPRSDSNRNGAAGSALVRGTPPQSTSPWPFGLGNTDSRPTTGESCSHRGVSSVASSSSKMLITQAQLQAQAERRSELLALLLEQQRSDEVDGGPTLPHGRCDDPPSSPAGEEVKNIENVLVEGDSEQPPARRPKMPSFIRHNNQTKARTLLGDMRTSTMHPPSSSSLSAIAGSKRGIFPSEQRQDDRSGAGNQDVGKRCDAVGSTENRPMLQGTGLGPRSTKPLRPASAASSPLHHPQQDARSPPLVAGAPPPDLTPVNAFMLRCQNMHVTPIRPPKYRFPKFKGPQGPPKDLYVNGHLVRSQHPALALVQRLNLGVGLSNEAHQTQRENSQTISTSESTTQVGGPDARDGGSPDVRVPLPALPLSSIATQQTVAGRCDGADTSPRCNSTVTPRPLGMGVPSPRTVLRAKELQRTVIVVPTGSARSSISGSPVQQHRAGGGGAHGQNPNGGAASCQGQGGVEGAMTITQEIIPSK